MSPPPDIPCASARDTAKTIRPTASSIATTGSSVRVTGPFALYWRTTISVAAGAVAAAIAPSVSASGTSKPRAQSVMSTRPTAVSAWNMVIIMLLPPMAFILFMLNSPPIE